MTQRDVICERLREIFGQEPEVREWWTPGKVGSVGKVNSPRLDVSEKIQGKKIHSRVKAAVAHLGSSDRRSPALQEGVIGY